MTAEPTSSSRALRWGIVLALGLGLAACSKEEAAPAPAGAPAPAAAQPAGPSAEEVAAQEAAEAAEAALKGLSIDELRSRGSDALREQRLYAPAGDNAMEYYLALREKSEKPDASAEMALIDLMPYAIIAAEQAIGREDFVEADRLRSLIERSDAQTPALPRIKDSIAKGRAGVAERAQQEAAQAAQREREAELAAQRAAQEAAAAAAAATQPAPTPAPVATQPAQPATPAPTEPAATQPAQPPAPEPTVARASNPVPVRAPQPSYPRAAYRSGVSGEVTVEIAIAANGSVTDVRVIRSQPRGTFDREVINTVRDWQFEPMDGPATLTRTFSFKP
ncbi:energy transducer TonB [Arenimonas caeni]|jgi:protein TonB|uniref:Protein TonB n=1 Tax=Arenimonas caeni TaxID=2058085 RepID=A0A2P6M7J1_9GAMM|nr:energy transducer TonB [Arenimonas caeni]MDY0022842.1 energy transducer TonB [Arenimonas caeni]PRH81940.1 energy transducer TonB [Arenimonas caeni]